MQRVMLEDLDDQGTADIGVTQEPLDFTVAKEDGLYYNGTRLTTKNEEETETEGIQSDEEEPSGGEDEEQEQTYTLTLNLQTQPDSETYLVLKNAVLKGNMTETPINISFQNAENELSYKFRSDDDTVMAPDSRIMYLISAITKMHLRPVISFDWAELIF